MQEQLEKLKGLCELFKANIKQYKSLSYDEANTRTDFIDKFFELLDWDVRNTQGFAENYREVVREDKVVIQGKPKAPDYSFRIGGIRKFFLEAKKPSVNIKEDIEPAFQVRRYGYTAKLSLCILTDFEEFSVYDTRIKPSQNDKASVARIFYCTYEEYEKNFEFIYNTFSKTAILKGSFDKYITENTNKKGTSDVDKEFLALIESWREDLAKNIALRNKELDVYSLNTAVQTVIDRIIFLRIAEDRNMENYGILLDSIKAENVYQDINQIFLKANDKYNSGLFKPIDWISNLKIDDKILQNIIKHLYYPESPYEFSVLPIEILGNIYEQFLGKTIRLTSSHQAKVEEKEEVRKAGGVYYTPQYIVKYIVGNTIGEKIKNLNLYEHPNLTVLDPACGSGSFLVGAYSYLLNEYLQTYTNNKNLNRCLKNGLIYQVSENTYRLSIEVKQKILLNHIFGVDIDHQAVEVTKLSLLLKLMEDENTESADLLFKHSDLKLLPDLSDNIKCGNSLIGSDFYKGKNLSLFGKEEMRKINVFDWEKEFSEIFKDGGFDVVIGNPPYVYLQDKDSTNYYRIKFVHQDYQLDLYLLFLEKYSFLLKNRGLLGVIISNTWLQSLTMKKIRKYLSTQYQWLKILHLPEKVFKAVVDTQVIIFEKTDQYKEEEYVEIDIRKSGNIFQSHKIKILEIPKDGNVINVITNPEKQKLFKKIINNCVKLKDICYVYNGAKPFEKGKGKPPQTDKIMKEKSFVFENFLKEEERNGWSPLLRGSLINRYINYWNYNSWIQYGEWLAAPRNPQIFEEPLKIMVRQTGDSIIGTLVEKGFIGRDNLHIIISKNNINLVLVLSIINSKLIDFIYSIFNPEKGEALAQVKKKHLEELPIPKSEKLNLKITENLIFIANQMLSAQKEFRSAMTESDKKLFQQKCNLLDEQIDELVYELYGLTEEEIKIVEGLR